MKIRTLSLFLFSTFLNLASAEQREPIRFEALPESVRHTVSEHIDQRKISSVDRVVTDDNLVKYEIKTDKTAGDENITATAMTVAADGEIMMLAKETPIFKIPYPVMNRINHAYPNIKASEVEVVLERYFLLSGEINGKPIKLKIFDNGSYQEIAPAGPSESMPQQVLDQPGSDAE